MASMMEPVVLPNPKGFDGTSSLEKLERDRSGFEENSLSSLTLSERDMLSMFKDSVLVSRRINCTRKLVIPR